ncbi:MAG: hypothetical protein NC347_12990 [Clostridium sp.]|nr:hypothetical protein [Clostridium sp.]
MKQKVINLIFAVLLVMVGAYFLLGELLLPSDKLNDYSECAEYSGEWKRIMPDGTTDAVTMPGKCVAGRNETVVVETELQDDMESGRYLCFRSAKQDMRFFVDGQLRSEYSTKESRLFGRMSAAAYVFLEINEEDAGKVLRVELCFCYHRRVPLEYLGWGILVAAFAKCSMRSTDGSKAPYL